MIERFIEDYSERGFQFAFQLCGNAEDAKELVQEAFFRVIRKWDQCDRSQSLENWFLTILRNLYYDSMRKYERRCGVSLDAPALARGEEGFGVADRLSDGRQEALIEILERRESQEEVQAVLESLRPELRAVLSLCDMQGLRYEEIAKVLDWPIGTVRSRLSRARSAFKQALLERSGKAWEVAR